MNVAGSGCKTEGVKEHLRAIMASSGVRGQQLTICAKLVAFLNECLFFCHHVAIHSCLHTKKMN